MYLAISTVYRCQFPLSHSFKVRLDTQQGVAGFLLISKPFTAPPERRQSSPEPEGMSSPSSETWAYPKVVHQIDVPMRFSSARSQSRPHRKYPNHFSYASRPSAEEVNGK